MLQNHLQYFPHYGQSNLRYPPKQVVFCWLDMVFLQLMANKITQKLAKAGFELAFITADLKKTEKAVLSNEVWAYVGTPIVKMLKSP